MTEDILSDLKDALGRRSRLERWMWDNFDEFKALLDHEKPNWPQLTERFERHGLAEPGKPFGRDTVRQTWYRVRQRRAALAMGEPTSRLPSKS